MEPQISGGAAESVLSEMRREFLDELADGARDLTLAIDEARRDPATLPDVVRRGQRFGLSIRAQSETLGLSPLVAIGLRLGDYLAQTRNVASELILNDMECFLELALDIGEGRVPLDAEQGPLVRKLPAKRGFAPTEIEVRDIEIVLVMEPGAQTHFVERELQQCGYRTIHVGSTYEALPLIVRTKPNMVIVSAMLPGLSGIDLAIGLTAMPETRNVSVALITSLDPDNEMLALLPKRVPIIKKGATFGDDLFNALDNLFLI